MVPTTKNSYAWCGDSKPSKMTLQHLRMRLHTTLLMRIDYLHGMKSTPKSCRLFFHTTRCHGDPSKSSSSERYAYTDSLWLSVSCRNFWLLWMVFNRNNSYSDGIGIAEYTFAVDLFRRSTHAQLLERSSASLLSPHFRNPVKSFNLEDNCAYTTLAPQ